MQKNAYKTVATYLLAALSIIFLVSCAHTPDIAGTWREPGKTSTLEFRKDGTFIAVDDMGMSVRGNYILEANGNVQFRIKHRDSSVEIIRGTLTIRGDELIVIADGEKEALIYKKTHWCPE